MSNDEHSPILSRDHGAVRQLILNAAPAHNSLKVAFTQALLHALEAAVAKPQVRAILISANGPSFCAGGDLKEMLAQGDAIADYVDDAMRTAHNPLIRFIDECTKPIVMAVQGAAVGAGAGLAFSADLTVASHTASFQFPFVPRLGIVPDAGCSWQLVQSLGYRRALGYLLTGEALTASAAKDAGLIWDCVDLEELESRALALAQQLAQLPARAVARTREVLQKASLQGMQEQLDLERRLQRESFADSHIHEALRAIGERRAPDFTSCE